MFTPSNNTGAFRYLLLQPISVLTPKTSPQNKLSICVIQRMLEYKNVGLLYHRPLCNLQFGSRGLRLSTIVAFVSESHNIFTILLTGQ